MSLTENFKTGRSGERVFEQFCDDAHLFVSRCEPDMTGKDRYVEFPLAPFSVNNSYDKRLPPLACYVQIKSTKTKINQVQIGLANAERLIRDPKPTFVFIARVNGNAVIEAYLVHFGEQIIARVLKSLRMAQAAGSQQLHKINFWVPFGDADEIDGAKDLRRRLESDIGCDMLAYAASKAKLLQTLGYEESHIHISLEFESLSSDDYLDGILGLKSLPVESLKVFESRFNIQILDHEAENATISIKPSEEMKGKIAFFDLKGNIIAALEGFMSFASVGTGSNHAKKLLHRSPMFSFLIRNNGIKIWTPDAPPEKISLSVLLQSFRAWRAFLEGDCQIGIGQTDDVQPMFPLPKQEPNLKEISQICASIDLLEKTIAIKSFIKYEDADVDMNDLINQSTEISKFFEKIKSNKPTISIFSVAGDRHENFTLPQEKCLCLNLLIIGDELFVVTIRADATIIRSEDSTKIETRNEVVIACEKLEEPFRANMMLYREKMTKITGVSLVLEGSISESG